jgi:hypothetical protein
LNFDVFEGLRINKLGGGFVYGGDGIAPASRVRLAAYPFRRFGEYPFHLGPVIHVAQYNTSV